MSAAALALAAIALAVSLGALQMIIKQKKRFTSLLDTVRELEDKQPPARIVEEPQSPRPEPPSAEPPRPEPPGPEPPSAERPSPEPPRTEHPRAEVPGPERPSPESPDPRAEPAAPAPRPQAQLPPPDPAWQRWLDQLRTLPHGAVAALLGEVLQHSAHLARGLADAAQSRAFRHEVGEGFKQRLVRFQQCAPDESTFEKRWVEPDLITALDLLARFQSQAAEDARDGHDPASQLAAWLHSALYDKLGPACQAEGWFALERVEPFRTAFDPLVHKGVDGRQLPGARGMVVEVQKVGRLHPTEGYALQKAAVVVGR